jgi:hypothetical protein
MKIISIILISTLMASCSTMREWANDLINNPQNKKVQQYENKDYMDQLAYLGGEYLNTPGVKTIRLSGRSRNYLKSIYHRVVENSELILEYNVSPKFYIISNKIPFYFSLPGSQFFMSSGLVKKFFKNEHLLVAALSHEIVKSHRSIYQKKSVVPIGFLSTEKMLSLTSVPLKIKMEVNKWTFYVLKRAGYDSTAYLNWLQTQNKNTLDFMFQLGSGKQISKEEFLFKSFIVKQGIIEKANKLKGPSNSSKSFYKFVSEIGRSRI